MTFMHGDEVVGPILVFSIPLVAIAGGILASIVKTISAHRLMEAAVRERMALIARGVDPDRIAGATGGLGALSPGNYARLHAQRLLINGFAWLAGGLAGWAFLGLTDAGDGGNWALALIPTSIGVVLVASGLVLWPRSRDASARVG